MAKNEPGVRIEFENLEGFPSGGYSDRWPAGLADPSAQAAVDLIMRNYGTKGRQMYQTENDMNYLRQDYPERFGYDFLGGFMADPSFDFYTKDEYEMLLDTAQRAFAGDEDAAESLNSIIRHSNSVYSARKKRK